MIVPVTSLYLRTLKNRSVKEKEEGMIWETLLDLPIRGNSGHVSHWEAECTG